MICLLTVWKEWCTLKNYFKGQWLCISLLLGFDVIFDLLKNWQKVKIVISWMLTIWNIKDNISWWYFPRDMRDVSFFNIWVNKRILIRKSLIKSFDWLIIIPIINISRINKILIVIHFPRVSLNLFRYWFDMNDFSFLTIYWCMLDFFMYFYFVCTYW